MYTFNKILPGTTFEAAVDRAREALAGHGFGIPPCLAAHNETERPQSREFSKPSFRKNCRIMA
jgi:hypothetical protein